jgi:glucans biosynthesis protein
VEIPITEETNDNIVAFWVPRRPFKAGESRSFVYELRTFGGHLPEERLATVHRTRNGWGAIPGAKDKPKRDLRQFIVDFRGGELRGLDGSQPLEADITASTGRVQNVTVERLPGEEDWRVAFKLSPDGEKPVDMRMFLSLRGQRVSETWSYVWRPELVR